MKIYCSGIGGIGLSAYAAFQKKAGHDVSGSDRTPSIVTEDLIRQGIPVLFEQHEKNISRSVDLFVYSEAVPSDAPERVRAKDLQIRCVSYFEALGGLSKDYRTIIAICGSHGKSTTTAMVATMLVNAKKNPTVIVGTRVPQLNGRNFRQGTKDFLVVEACEYRSSFLNFCPQIVLMTNVDWDHVDAFPSPEKYEAAYVTFLKQIPSGGLVITHGRDPRCHRVAKEAKCHMVDADLEEMVPLHVPGEHMQKNAQLVLELARTLGISDKEAKHSLRSYRGCWRRMELKGYYQLPTTNYQLPVIDDYAHHPTEIRATLKALKEAYSGRRLVCVFQPHMHNRTREFYDDFCTAFHDADECIMTDVYDARSTVEKEHIDMEKFARDTKVAYGGDLKATEQYLHSMLKEGDVLVCMGAGDITDLALCIVQGYGAISLPSQRG